MTTPHGIIFAPPSTSKLLTFTTLNQQNEILNIPHIRSSMYILKKSFKVAFIQQTTTNKMPSKWY